ncbi:hypothetical protein [Mycolicibacterium gadium]|uniref:Uncharacterized protein n=1 Tax=Mycolicibacterium gadium TaxID=1794 RepID=A0A7I7WG94_MYCGU|nr:hypothetical protein [Mycolicibacterium gadium]BBZ15867.1 hypothetical protein MGAD_02020 [Mycolicibacterium gadium]
MTLTNNHPGTNRTPDDEEPLTIEGILRGGYDYHALMNQSLDDSKWFEDTGILTLDSGGISLHFGPTNLFPPRPQWQVAIFAEDVDDQDPDVAGHICNCGHGPHVKGDEPCYQVIRLGYDDAIRLANLILSRARPAV